jgi:hypothetical protein
VFIVEAEDGSRALAWGDHLARRRAATSGEPFIKSHLETDPDLPGVDALPVVRDGHEASDEEIGW